MIRTLLRRGLPSLLVLAAFAPIQAQERTPERTYVPIVGESAVEASDADRERLASLVAEVDAEVQSMSKLAQVIVDKLFSFSELGFQEFETLNYLVPLLEENGFAVETGQSGIPTAWFARWGSGRPVIAFGSDIDGIPKSNQKPGVAYEDPIVEGAPGHGEGHNSGQAVNIVAALALKKVMEREGIEGTIVLWPGVAEELVASKAWFVRDGHFDDVDATLFTHVSSNLSVTWGVANGTGLVSAEFTFAGQSAHSAGSPWRARSALDAVELMNVGWNFRREHLQPNQRSHYVITDGGDQPNVVPSRASVWYYFREMEQPAIQRNLDIGVRMAEGAAMMTDTELEWRILGTAYPRHFNRVIAETMGAHIDEVGLPEWTDDDHALASAIQSEMGSIPSGMPTSLSGVSGPSDTRRSGGSDDIGDISWTVPTITLRFPSNIPGLPGHHWSNGVAMATPIAHKGAVAGARVMARTTLELFLRPQLVDQAWDYFVDEQGASHTYTPFIDADDPAPIDLNTEIMRLYKPLLEPFYYDETRYDTYLEQLGITYPTVRSSGEGGGG
ncbi:amidohydrolase [Gaopeijia maritima]|uniref:Amidohydrolase n=1 Tax=Gaopeijia maritima TaxID=3119007 RepID=A0ABU9EF39_9BACT